MAFSTFTSSVIVFLALMATAEVTSAAITCGFAVSRIAPCVPYVTRGGGVPPACCSGIRTLTAAATTTADRQAGCRCIKDAASRIRELNPSLAAGLPGRCGVNIPYTISASIDCTKVR